MRSKYWSCSKFADWIRGGTPKLSSGTSDEWKNWEYLAKKERPIRFWIAEEGLDYLQNVIMFPSDIIWRIHDYYMNRFVDKSHALTASPKDVKPGEWCDLPERIMFCLFNELVNFVEKECAYMHVVFDDDARKKYNAPNTRFGLKRWRCPEAGIAHLEWQSSFVGDDGSPKLVAVSASETLELYRWWIDVYNTRNEDIWDLPIEDIIKIENERNAEDEEMLIRLIKVRNSLWT